MKVFSTVDEIKNHLKKIKEDGKTIGFVPTMGALHEGHLSLIREAKNDSSYVVSSIFVNPDQFTNKEDLAKYPRNEKADIALLEKEKCDVLFLPSVKEIYPETNEINFDFGNLDKVMEGEFRPGHFQGVARVVKRLFEIIEPQKAFFGMKDYQQMVIIHKLTKDYNLGVEIIPCPTQREENQLAMSSRNERLSKQGKQEASLIYQALKMAKIQAGYMPIPELKHAVERRVNKSKSLELEYFEIVDMYSLKSLNSWGGNKNVIACIAVNVGDVRLIDNMILFS
ncbi:MAG: pantoate--beta-alanine ligase [Bacteroidetes bacterium]|nr:MAG: pantoate--beta-alanine ligase [Bacteroidota bacterium]